MNAVADSIHRTIVGEAELITSLSVAIIGGLLALLMQIQHLKASHPDQAITLLGLPWFVAGLSLAAVSVAAGLAVTGMMIQGAPALFYHEFDASLRFSEQSIKNAPFDTALQLLAMGQQIAFGLSVGCATIVLYRNRP